MDNIHDKANLVALCHKCHFAFDNYEWTFLPVDMAMWVQEMKAEPGKDFIRQHNSQRNVSFQSVLLLPDPESEAFQDRHYQSAFVDQPTKVWVGEPGVVILRNGAITTSETTTKETDQLLEAYIELVSIWRKYDRSCSKDDCVICVQKQEGNENYEDTGDQDGDDDWDDDNKDKEDLDNNMVDELASGKKRKSSIGKLPKRSQEGWVPTHRATRMVWRRKRGLAPKVVEFRRTTQRKQKPKSRKQTKKIITKDESTPYDESVPWSHRVGYTWHGTTSNELMAMWQAYRTPLAEAQLQNQITEKDSVPVDHHIVDAESNAENGISTTPGILEA